MRWPFMLRRTHERILEDHLRVLEHALAIRDREAEEDGRVIQELVDELAEHGGPNYHGELVP